MTGDAGLSMCGVYDESYIPDVINLYKIKNKGTFGCGSKSICEVTIRSEECGVSANTPDFVVTNQFTLPLEDLSTETEVEKDFQLTTKACIVGVLMNKIGIGVAQKNSFDETPVSFPEASGSAKSIIEWGITARLDEMQKRAIGVFTSSYVLTYYRGAEESEKLDCAKLRNMSLLKEKLRLMKLSAETNILSNLINRTEDKSLICFMHGPGGSGKSAVIDLLISYAREYTNY